MAYNPAGLVQELGGEVELSHTQWFQGFLYENLNASLPLNDATTLGFGIQYLDVPAIQGTEQIANTSNPDQNYSLAGTFSPYDLAVRMAIGTRFSPNLLLGGSLQLINESIDGTNFWGLGFDLGFLYLSPIEGLNLGFAVQNLGIPISDGDQSFDQPLNLRLGASYRGWIDHTVVLAEFDIPEDAPEVLALGAEYELGQNIFLRGGYRYDSLFNPWSLGLGVKWQPFALDFTAVPYGELGMTYRASLHYAFGQPGVSLSSRQVLLTSLSPSAGTRLELGVEAPAYARSWRLNILDDARPPFTIKTIQGFGAVPRELIWDARSDSGLAVAEGNYWALLSVRYSNGESLASPYLALQVSNAVAQVSLALDPISSDPRFPGEAFLPLQFRPRVKGPTPQRWRLEILDAQGNLFRSLEGQGSPPEQGLLWDGKGEQGEDFISNRTYQAQLKVWDALGREGQSAPALQFTAVFR